jgi:hypothetical protein
MKYARSATELRAEKTLLKRAYPRHAKRRFPAKGVKSGLAFALRLLI